jgi:hypothetical protein
VVMAATYWSSLRNTVYTRNTNPTHLVGPNDRKTADKAKRKTSMSWATARTNPTRIAEPNSINLPTDLSAAIGTTFYFPADV